MAATTRRRAASAELAAEAPAPALETPDYEVVGDTLICHPHGGLRLSLVVPMSIIDRWIDINSTAGTWREQVAAWQAEIIPADILATIRDVAGGDGMLEIELCRRWSDGLDVRLGKALS